MRHAHQKISMGIRWAHMGNWYGIRGPICHPFGAIHLNGPNWYRPKVDHLLDMVKWVDDG